MEGNESLPNVDWPAHDTPSTNFSTPFEVKASNGKIWIKATFVSEWEELYLNGANWAGFQAEAGCVHELWKHDVTEYIEFLSNNRFNAVRLPLSAAIVTWAIHGRSWNLAGHDEPGPYRVQGKCGLYQGWLSLQILDDVITRLRDKGIFVMLDMHTTDIDGNQATWCTNQACDTAGEQLIFDAWAVIASRYCSFANVILADVFNEPYGSLWPAWQGFVQRIGGQILSQCPRWLIVAQGIAGDQWCWGENILGQSRTPIVLPVAERLVMSVHSYGHFNFGYFRDPTYPNNLAAIFNGHFGWAVVRARRSNSKPQAIARR